MEFNKKEMNIRIATLADVETITDFQMAMALETENLVLDREVLRNGVEAVIVDSNKGRIYVAETGEEEGVLSDMSGCGCKQETVHSSGKVRVTGSLMITFEWSDWRNGLILWIQSLYVLPEYRKKGVFKCLYEYIKSSALADKNIKGVRLYVDKRNIRAQKVYEAIGMCGEHYTTYEWMK